MIIVKNAVVDCKMSKDRSLFYVTFPIRDQTEKGNWSFKLAPIYFVAILNFEYDEEERRKFRRDMEIAENAIKAGLDDETVTSITGLDINVIEKLRQKLKR